MNYCVPEFVAEEDNGMFPSFFMPRNADRPTEQGLAELVWQKGPVLRRRTSDAPSAPLPNRTEPSVWSFSGAAPVAGTELFMEEDEMASLLDYPLGDEDGGGGGFQVSEAEVGGWAASGRQPLPPEVEETLSLFHRDREPNAEAAAAATTRDSTVVGSSVTPWLLARVHPPESRTSSGDGGGGTGTLEHGRTSSSGGFCDGEATVKAALRRDVDRKRKARERDDSDCHSEDAEFESSDLKEGSRRSASKRRSRAAEVHNLSERRRRDRINEKMKALRQLIPRCNKSDKASMLDDAIEYLKALQMQVHMMSLGCNMVPMMFPGMQRYVPPMGMAIPMGMSMGMGMGMGMGMEMGAGALSHPMAPFLPVMSGAHHMVATGAAAPPLLGTGVPVHPLAAAGFACDPVELQAAAGQTADPAACPAAPPAGIIAAQVAPNHSNPCQQYAAGFHQSSQVRVPPRIQGQATAGHGSRRRANTAAEKPKNIGISRR